MKKTHPSKTQAAESLVKRGLLPEELPEILRILNQARKATIYEGEDLDLGTYTLEDISIAVEQSVDAAERRA